MTIKGPCRKDCPERCVEPNCHDRCERYLAYKEECKRINEERNKAYSEAVAFQRDQIAKVNRRLKR